MKINRLGVVALLAIAAVLVLSSCGGGGDKRLTKEQFAVKANALCATFSKQVNSLDQLTLRIDLYRKLIPHAQELIAGLKKLKPPADEEADVKKAIALNERQLDRARAIIAALKKRAGSTVIQLETQGFTTQSEIGKIFNKLGATECAG